MIAAQRDPDLRVAWPYRVIYRDAMAALGDDAPNAWVRVIRAWDDVGVAEVRHRLHGGLVWLLSRYDRPSPLAVTNAISRAMAAVTHDVHLDDIDLAGVAATSALAGVGLTSWDDHAGAAWLALRPGQRFLLAVMEVEQVPASAVSRVFPLPPATLQAGYASACAAVGLQPLAEVACPGWRNVARMYRSREDDAADALLHVQRCPRCGPWHVDRDARRARLADLAPSVGATGIGFVLEPGEGIGGIGGPSRNVGFGGQLAPRRRSRSTLWS